MLSDQAKDAVAQAKPQEGVSLVIYIHPDADLVSVRQVKNLADRRRQLCLIYQDAKQPILDSVSDYESAGLRIIASADNSPTMVLSGPAKVWRQFLRKNRTLFADPKFDVVANTMVATTA